MVKSPILHPFSQAKRPGCSHRGLTSRKWWKTSGVGLEPSDWMGLAIYIYKYIWLYVYVYIYICMCIYIYMYTYIAHQLHVIFGFVWELDLPSTWLCSSVKWCCSARNSGRALFSDKPIQHRHWPSCWCFLFSWMEVSIFWGDPKKKWRIPI